MAIIEGSVLSPAKTSTRRMQSICGASVSEYMYVLHEDAIVQHNKKCRPFITANVHAWNFNILFELHICLNGMFPAALSMMFCHVTG